MTPRTTRSLVDLVLPVSGEERTKSLLSFALFAVFMASYYALKPVRGSLYVHYLGAERLPHAYIGAVGVSLVAMAIYNRVFLRIGGERLLPATVVLLCGCALVFRLVHAAGAAPGPLSVVLFLWVTLYGALVAALFWSLANDIFDSRTGRKVYGFVGIGGLVGALVGSAVTHLIVQLRLAETEDLLILGGLLVLGTLPLMRRLRRLAGPPTSSPPGEPRPRRRDGWYWIISDAYVAGMAALVFLFTFVGTFLDLQYNRVVQAALPGKDAKTAYFSRLYGWVNGLAVTIQLLVTGPLHRRWGPLPGLLPLPAIGVVAPLVLIFRPTLTAVTLVWALGLALLYSLNQASKELLYIPTPPEVKYGAKGHIDVTFYRLGDALASALAIIFDQTLGQRSVELAGLCLAMVAVWFVLVAALGRGYRRRLAGAHP